MTSIPCSMFDDGEGDWDVYDLLTVDYDIDRTSCYYHSLSSLCVFVCVISDASAHRHIGCVFYDACLYLKGHIGTCKHTRGVGRHAYLPTSHREWTKTTKVIGRSHRLVHSARPFTRRAIAWHLPISLFQFSYFHKDKDTSCRIQTSAVVKASLVWAVSCFEVSAADPDLPPLLCHWNSWLEWPSCRLAGVLSWPR